MRLLACRAALLLVGLALPAAARASGEGEDLDPVHHSSDGYYLDGAPLYKLELPRLFLVRRADGGFGFDAYASTASALRSGRYVAEAEHATGGQAEVHGDAAHASGEEIEDVLHQEIRGTEATPAAGAGTPVEALIESGAHLDAHIIPAEGSMVIDFSVTRHLFFMLVGSVILLVMALRMAGKYRRGIGARTAPRGRGQNAFETLVMFVRDEIARPNIGPKADRFVPYLLTAFFFILVLNLLGLVPFSATATANISVTAVLATFTFVMTQVFASKDHWKHVFWPPGVPTFVKPILIPVEILGLFTKPFALAIRLFANMTAGHLVILSLIGLIFTFAKLFGAGAGYGVAPVSIAFALFIYCLEILVAFLQAYVFTMLSAIFIGMAVAEHDHHDHEHAHGPGARHDLHEAGDIDQRDGQMALTV